MPEISVKKISVSTIVVIVLFVTPHIFLSIIPRVISSYYSITIYSLALGFFILKSNYISSKYSAAILFAVSFIFGGTVIVLLKNSTTLFNVFAPLFGLFGYLYIRQNVEMNIKFIKYIMMSFYLYFYFVYYRVIPDYFFRAGFDEDAVVFDNSSSNAISMTLVMLLFIYLILNRYYRSNQNRTLFHFSLINIVLVFIQQSRIALLISVILFFISFHEYSKKYLRKFLVLLTLTVVVLLVYFWREILLVYDLLFSEYNIRNISEDMRSDARTYFVSNLAIDNFFIGYPDNTIFASARTTKIFYTYNVFLDVWNRYGFFSFVILIAVLLYRFVFHRRYYFPLYYFLPFLVYSFFESIFFPNFWDCFIYILIFTPIEIHKIDVE